MKTREPIVNPFLRTADQVRLFVELIETVYMFDCPQNFGTERRAVKRMNVTMPVRMTPLDNDFKPLSYEYHAITRDLSTKGVGLVTTNPVGHDFVLLTLEPYQSKSFDVIARVAHCNGYGYYFRVGCEFVIA